MLFSQVKGKSEAISKCGRYRITWSIGMNEQPFYNAYQVESGKHVSAGYDREQVKEECQQHANR